MMASNEFEEAWMDEGVNEYMTGHTMRAMFPEPQTLVDFLGLQMSYDAMAHRGYSNIADWDPLETYAWRFSRGHYFVVYPKTAVALRTLEGYLGHEKMMACLRNYTANWRFKHPHAQDFFDSFSQAAGQDLMWFFRPAFLETRVLDYEITDLRSEEKSPPLGLFDKDGQRSEVKKRDEGKHPFESEVLVHRKGDFVFPVEIEVHFEDGERERVKWDGADRWKRFTFEKSKRADWATVDPDGIVQLDVNWFNNGKRRESASLPSDRMRMGLMFWVQNLLQGVGL
jgi:peptidase M1-like protein